MCSETETEKVAKEGGLNEGLGRGLFNSSLSFDLLVIISSSRSLHPQVNRRMFIAVKLVGC